MAKGLLRKILVATLSSVAALLIVGAITSVFSGKECSVHEWDDGVITKKATCQTDGKITYTCDVCGEEKTEALKASVLYHVWDEGEVLTEASCSNAGETLYTCTVCEEERTETVQALPHKYRYIETESKPAGHTEPGWDEYECSVCGNTYQVEVPAYGGTCVSEDGDFLCDLCGAVQYPEDVGYVEVEAQIGEKVLGNWYRIYRPKTNGGDLYSTNGFKLSAYSSNAEANIEELRVYSYEFGLKDAFTQHGRSWSDLSTYTISTEEYVDVYMDKGLLYEEAPSLASGLSNGIFVYVDENTTIESISNYDGEGVVVYRLVPHSSCMDANEDVVCDECGKTIAFAEGSYTEVAVTAGEAVAGNWYRIYIPEGNQASIVLSSRLTIVEWEYSCNLTIVVSSEGIISIGGGSTTAYVHQENSLIKIIEGDGYYDVYFGKGTFKEDDFVNKPSTVDIPMEETLIKSVAYVNASMKEGIYRLQLNEAS